MNRSSIRRVATVLTAGAAVVLSGAGAASAAPVNAAPVTTPDTPVNGGIVTAGDELVDVDVDRDVVNAENVAKNAVQGNAVNTSVLNDVDGSNGGTVAGLLGTLLR